MDFGFSDEQRLLRDSLSRYLGDTYSADLRRKTIASETGWRPDIWRALAVDLGILGAALPEAVGGFGGGAVENLVIMEELGRSLLIEPYFETIVLGAGILKRFDTPNVHALLEGVIAGDVTLAFAWGEATSRFDATDVSTTATRDGSGYRLDGRKAVVSAAPWATHLLVTARTAGERRDRAGISLFLVENNAEGVIRRDYPTVDGRRASEIAFDGVRLGADALLGEEGHALPLVEQVLDEGRAALCAEALGVLSEMQRQTVEYARQRKQFGRPIADFQVLQHRLVDMFMRSEQSVSMAYMATLKLDLPASERMRAVAAAKYYIGQACTFVGQNAIQIHGGIGLTDELPLSHYFKRATMIEVDLGSSDFHLRRYQAAA